MQLNTPTIPRPPIPRRPIPRSRARAKMRMRSQMWMGRQMLRGTSKTLAARAVARREQARRRGAEATHGPRETTRLLAAGGVGAAIAYLLDPADGKRRRHMLRDRTLAVGRRGARQMQRRAGYATSRAEDMAQRAQAAMDQQPRVYDDITLARKVESELLRPEGAPKGRLNVSAHEGVVELRGQLDSELQIEALCKAAEAIDGVRGVENLLHVTGTPAPHARA